LSWPHFGDPTFMFSDVERAVKRRLRAAKAIDIFRLLETDATRRRELTMLARLQEKYGARTPTARSGAHWLAAVFTCPSRTIGLPRDPGRTDRQKAHAIGHTPGRQAILSEPCYMIDTVTVAEKLKEAGFSEVQAAALTRAIEAAATIKAELVEARMNKDLETIIERSDAKFERSNASFEKTVREQTRWIATIVFSAIGLMIAFYGIALHFK
jgi:hypothetical protein